MAFWFYTLWIIQPAPQMGWGWPSGPIKEVYRCFRINLKDIYSVYIGHSQPCAHTQQSSHIVVCSTFHAILHLISKTSIFWMFTSDHPKMWNYNVLNLIFIQHVNILSGMLDSVHFSFSKKILIHCTSIQKQHTTNFVQRIILLIWKAH